MSAFQDLIHVLYPEYLRVNNLTRFLPGTRNIVIRLSESMPSESCDSGDDLDACRDDAAALPMKLLAIGSILVASLVGIALPLLGRKRRLLQTDSNLFVVAKAFAAGVILSTGFVHLLPDGSENLTDPCLPEFPWSMFPFAGLFAMCSALLTLVADFVGTQLYERKQQRRDIPSQEDRDGSGEPVPGPSNIVLVQTDANDGCQKVFGEEEGGGMHIVGMRAHAAHHSHSHELGQEACDGQAPDNAPAIVHAHHHGDEEEGEGYFGHSHSHVHDVEVGSSRHVVVSQVLELGIVSHSMMIGLSLGVSHSPCTIRPLIAALSFHQFFEGFALGGCIAQAQLKRLSTLMMVFLFTLTTPVGIAIGIGAASSYNTDSARALIVEGILDCVSAGILIYMALVDLIAADFMSKRMRCNVRLQVASYFALFLGAAMMSSLAIWA